ncbi:MAG: folate-binding protein YgfZ [Rhodospirillales bacterium]|nr:folate-binding protein YgfZ [Rhodospirillales bacterium]MCB9995218.1 folate-binding protein YgfZ [Rhodospirillales bacterium]
MNAFFVKLQNRGLIHIEGEDRFKFLQGLISNDINLLESQPSLYACLLTPQGKFLHDFFVIKGDDFLLIDCEGGDRAQDLYKRLNLYRLRAAVTLSVENNNDVYALVGASANHAVPDARHPNMGFRSFEKPVDMEEQPFAAWDEHRIRLCVPDGSRDMIPQSSTLIECRIDTLNGVSFKKGCYVGQELTARMHHRGLAKKHLYAVESDALPPPGTEITDKNSKIAGEMRSSCGAVGIAQIKDEAQLHLADLKVIC